MSSFPLVLKHLLAAGPLTAQQQDLLLDLLPAVPDVDDVLAHFVRKTPAEHWTPRTARALHDSQSSTLRGEGWHGTGTAGLAFTTSEWESAALVEGNRHVRRELLTVAPADASRDAIRALVDATTLDIDPAKAADVEELASVRAWFAYDLLEHMPAHAGWACAELLQYADPTLADITKANAALRHCDPLAGATDPRVPALYRLRLAAHPSVPAGVMRSVVTDLRADRPVLAALSVTMTAGTHLRTAFADMLDMPVGTGEDRAALLEFMTAADVIGVHPMKKDVDHHDELLHLERTGRLADAVVVALRYSTSVVKRPGRVRGLWDRLPVEHRTDEVCLEVIKADEGVSRDVVAHLGSRAGSVLEGAGMYDRPGRAAAPAWGRDLNRERWILEVRHEATYTRLDALLSLPDGPDQQVLANQRAVVDDLKHAYRDWPAQSAVGVLQHLDGDLLAEVFDHVPVDTLAVWANTGSPEAAQALWTGLRDAVTTGADQARSDCAVRVDQSLTAAVAALLSGSVTLPDLKVAQHL